MRVTVQWAVEYRGQKYGRKIVGEVPTEAPEKTQEIVESLYRLSQRNLLDTLYVLEYQARKVGQVPQVEIPFCELIPTMLRAGASDEEIAALTEHLTLTAGRAAGEAAAKTLRKLCQG